MFHSSVEVLSLARCDYNRRSMVTLYIVVDTGPYMLRILDGGVFA